MKMTEFKPIDVEHKRYKGSLKILKDFIRKEKIVTESAKAHVPSVVRYIVGHDYKGSWWGLPQSSLIYNALTQLRSWNSILVCRLVKGKITFVYHDLWPFLIRLADELPSEALTKVVEIHTESGRHQKQELPIKEWADNELIQTANKITREEAIEKLTILVPRSNLFFKDIRLYENN